MLNHILQVDFPEKLHKYIWHALYMMSLYAFPIPPLLYYLWFNHAAVSFMCICYELICDLTRFKNFKKGRPVIIIIRWLVSQPKIIPDKFCCSQQSTVTCPPLVARHDLRVSVCLSKSRSWPEKVGEHEKKWKISAKTGDLKPLPL